MLSTRHFTLIDAKRPIKNDDSDDSSENYYNPNILIHLIDAKKRKAHLGDS